MYCRKPSEVAAHLGLTARAVRYMCQRGDLKAIKSPGGHWLIDDTWYSPVPREKRPDENAGRRPRPAAAPLKRLPDDATAAAKRALIADELSAWPDWAGRRPDEYSPTRDRHSSDRTGP
jgi:hypothetical protein